MQRLRAELFAAITLGDLSAIVRRLVKAARAGDLAAIRIVLDRSLGKVPYDFDRVLADDEQDPDERFI